jgi:cytochrome c-type biogenesis protein CcmE
MMAFKKPVFRKPATRKRKRLYMVLAGLAVLGLAAGLALTAFRDNIVFFYSPSEVAVREGASGHDLDGRRIRLGGLVMTGSVKKLSDGMTTVFDVTDGPATIRVSYKGLLPDLFREGQGVVAEGKLQPDKSFIATEVLAKHDEKYMPPEVAAALKKSGHWEYGKKAGEYDKKAGEYDKQAGAAAEKGVNR